MDRIFIEDLPLRVCAGTYPEEKLHAQEIRATIELFLDLSRAAGSDDLADTVDYAAIERESAELAERSRFSLLERLAGAIGDHILTCHSAVSEVKVTLRKPRSAEFARTLGIEITRKRGN